MPIDYSLYPKDWRVIRLRILERAQHKCEFCGVPNHIEVMRDNEGKWLPADEALDQMEKMPYWRFCEIWGRTQTPTKIVLTIAHIDHDIANNSDDNLKALCQKCHLAHDTEQRSQSRKRNRDKKIGQKRMFEEVDPT